MPTYFNGEPKQSQNHLVAMPTKLCNDLNSSLYCFALSNDQNMVYKLLIFMELAPMVENCFK